MPRILADRHHSDLLYALQRLFEDRLGFELFVPVGHDDPNNGWWGEGIWRFGEVFGDDRLARQYLDVDAHWRKVESGLWITFDQCHPERPIYGCSLEWARAHDWDIILATVQENQEGFHRFAQEMKTKYCYHVGNARQGIDWSLDPLVLDATATIGDWDKAHGHASKVVRIVQEFDYWTTFRYRAPEYPERPKRITSFVNLLPKIPESRQPFEELSQLLPYEFRSYGHECPDGFLTPVAVIAEEMARSAWAYHDKPTGDGFGHVIHCWAAVGRPLIGHGRFYKGQRAEVFWDDGVTCIDLDKHSVVEAAEIIQKMSPDDHEWRCVAIREILERCYDPADDARAVMAYLKKETV